MRAKLTSRKKKESVVTRSSVATAVDVARAAKRHVKKAKEIFKLARRKLKKAKTEAKRARRVAVDMLHALKSKVAVAQPAPKAVKAARSTQAKSRIVKTKTKAKAKAKAKAVKSKAAKVNVISGIATAKRSRRVKARIRAQPVVVSSALPATKVRRVKAIPRPRDVAVLKPNAASPLVESETESAGNGPRAGVADT